MGGGGEAEGVEELVRYVRANVEAVEEGEFLVLRDCLSALQSLLPFIQPRISIHIRRRGSFSRASHSQHQRTSSNSREN
jgi:hypothetical protein